MRIAIIDLGTNTFNLLIRESRTDEVLHNDKIAVKLGNGGIGRGLIAEDAFQRGLQAMQEHHKTIQRFEADRVLAFATAAIRDASNGGAFVQAVKEQTGIAVEVIDGLREASLIMRGVAAAVELPEEVVLVVDIGGGSTEFILAKGNEPLWMNSYPLGVSRLLEQFRPSDPMEEEEVERVEAHFDALLQDLLAQCAFHRPRIMIGSSGSFDTLADMCRLRAEPDSVADFRPSSYFDMGVYRMIEREVIRATFEQRLAMPGMIPMRADMMVLSCLIIRWTLKHCGVQQMWGSRYALKEGVYFEQKA